MAHMVNLDSLLGPGDPAMLLTLMAQSCVDCTIEGCAHCRLIALALGRYFGPRLTALGPGYVACAPHGLVRDGHACGWGSVMRIVDA